MTFRFDDAYPDVVICEADEAIDSLTVQSGLEELRRLLEGGARWLIVDCSRVGYLSSVGLTTLIRFHKRMSDVEGEVMLAAVQPPLVRLLHLTRLDEVFQIHATVAEAQQAFARARA